MKTKKTISELSETDKFKAMLAKTRPIADDTGKYLAAILTAILLGILAVVLVLWLRPEYDPLIVIVAVFTIITPTTTSLLSFMKAEEAKEQAKETHLSVNSRLDAFIAQASASARAEGVVEGQTKANERTDLLAGKS